MATFLLFGKYSSEAAKNISRERTDKVVDVLKKFGGEVRSMYAVLGEKDLLFIVDFPDMGQAMKASVALHRMSGISFTTSPAITVDEFDTLIAEL